MIIDLWRLNRSHQIGRVAAGPGVGDSYPRDVIGQSRNLRTPYRPMKGPPLSASIRRRSRSRDVLHLERRVEQRVRRRDALRRCRVTRPETEDTRGHLNLYQHPDVEQVRPKIGRRGLRRAERGAQCGPAFPEVVNVRQDIDYAY